MLASVLPPSLTELSFGNCGCTDGGMIAMAAGMPLSLKELCECSNGRLGLWLLRTLTADTADRCWGQGATTTRG